VFQPTLSGQVRDKIKTSKKPKFKFFQIDLMQTIGHKTFMDANYYKLVSEMRATEIAKVREEIMLYCKRQLEAKRKEL
jgi:hypothetical protein